MEFYILREEPVSSGHFSPTGEKVEGVEAALRRCAELKEVEGARFAMQPYGRLTPNVVTKAIAAEPAVEVAAAAIEAAPVAVEETSASKRR